MAYIRNVRVYVGRHDLQADCCDRNAHDGAHVVRLELEAKTFDDHTDGDKDCPWNGSIQAALGVDIAIVRLGVQIDKFVGDGTCRYLPDEGANEGRKADREAYADGILSNTYVSNSPLVVLSLTGRSPTKW